MKQLTSFLLLSTLALPGLSTAQTVPSPPAGTPVLTGGNWSGAEFISRKETDIIVLYTIKSYAPFKQYPSIKFVGDTFVGYGVTAGAGVTGIAAGFTVDFTSHFYGGLLVGSKQDLNTAFQFENFTLNNCGVIVSLGYKF